MGKGGKSTGKIIASIAIGALAGGLGGSGAWFAGTAGTTTAGVAGVAGAGVSWATGITVASLVSTVWSAASGNKTNNSSANIQRFDKAQETMSSEGFIPIVYGMRKISGNQTWHQTNAEQNILHKHVVLCEGGIEGIESVTANELLIPTNGQTENTVFTIQNVKYPDAWAKKKGKYLHLFCNGTEKTYYLCNADDGSKAETFWEWQMSTSSLVSFINRLGDGWQAFPVAVTSSYPANLNDFYSNKMGDLLGEVLFWSTDLSIYDIDGAVDINRTGNDFIVEFRNGSYRYFKYTGRKQYVEEDSGEAGTTKGYKNVFEMYSYGVEDGGGASCYNNPVAVTAKTVTGRTEYNFYDCQAPSNYIEVGGYTDTAWLDMVFAVSNELNGNPSVSCVVKGKKVLDIRDGQVKYSTNPAMCLRDFIVSPRYGLGKWFTADDIDRDSWIEAANYCDEEITFLNSDGAYVKAKRYELNMVIDSQRSAIEWLQEILANFCGYIVFSDNKIKLKIEKQTDISYNFNDSNCSDVSVSPLVLSETPNRYKVTIIDALSNWSSVTALCEDLADQKERQKIVTKEVGLEGVISQNQALRLARFYRDYNLTCPLQVAFKTGQQAMHLEPGDVVTVSYHNIFSGLPIRIAEIRENNKGEFEISGRQYNDTIYGDDLGGGIQVNNYSSGNSPFYGDIPNPYDVNIQQQYYVQANGSAVSEVNISWKIPTYMYYSATVVEYSFDQKSWQNIATMYDGTSVTYPVTVGKSYYFRLRTLNTSNRLSSGIVIPSVYITGKDEYPADVKGLTATLINDGIQLNWNGVDEPDIRGYNIYMGKNVSGIDSCTLIQQYYNGTSLYVPTDDSGTYTFYVVAIDNGGGRSQTPASVAINVDYPPDVTNFIAVKNGDYVYFVWDNMGNYSYEIRQGNTWASSNTIARIDANTYTFFCPLIGTQIFSIKAYNSSGNYSALPNYLSINLTDNVNRNIIATFDEKLEGWSGSKINLSVDGLEGYVNASVIPWDDANESWEEIVAAWYDNSGEIIFSGTSLTLINNNLQGEYLADVELPEKVDARNWIQYNAMLLNSDITWDALEGTWETSEYKWIDDDDDNPCVVTPYIAIYNGDTSEYLEAFSLNNTTDGISSVAKESSHVTYDEGRFYGGAYIQDKTRLAWDTSIPREFYVSFYARHRGEINDHRVYMTLVADDYWIRVGYDKGFYAVDNNGKELWCYGKPDDNDMVQFFISQTETERSLKINLYANDKTYIDTKPYEPLGEFNEMRLY